MLVEAGTPLSYCCFRCGNPISFHNDIINTQFQSGNKRRAFLFYKARNVCLAGNETRRLLTGPHVIADVHCFGCNALIGWKYQKSFAAFNHWKEGKICLVMDTLRLLP